MKINKNNCYLTPQMSQAASTTTDDSKTSIFDNYNKPVDVTSPVSTAESVQSESKTVFETPTAVPTETSETLQTQSATTSSDTVFSTVKNGLEGFSGADWQEITPVQSSLSAVENFYVYTMDDGTTFASGDIENVSVKYNSTTGEISITGAKGGAIFCGKNSKVSVHDSVLDYIQGGSKKDSITIRNSTVKGDIDGGSGDDTIIIDNSVVEGTISGGAYLGWGGLVKDDDTIKIINNSIVQDISAGSGDDLISVSNSEVKGKLDANGGNDIIEVVNSKLKSILGGIGDDNFSFKDSTLDGKLLAGADVWEVFDFLNGDDTISIINSTADEINSGKGDDNISLTNSEAKTVDSKKGNDEVLITKNSKVGKVDSGKGNDKVVVSDSVVQEVLAGKGDDIVNIESSIVGVVDSGKGDDNVAIKKSQASKIEAAKGKNNIAIDKESNVGQKNISKDSTVETIEGFNFQYETMDISSIEAAQDVLNAKTSSYSHRELTEEEQYQALTIDFFVQNFENMSAQLEEQNNSDGVVNKGYNYVKELIDLGVSQEDVRAALKEQEKMINEMKTALAGESNISFEEVFEKWTGVEYDRENISEYLQNAQMYSLALTGLNKAESFKQALLEADNLNDALELYTNYYGSEEKGREELNKILQETIPESPLFFNTISIEINEQNQLIRTMSDEMDCAGNYPPDSVYTVCDDLSDVANVIRTMQREFDLDKYGAEFKTQLEDILGCSFETMQNDYVSSQLKAFGNSSSFQKLIDKYCADQEGFKDRLASACQIGGIGLIVVGGITTFACPPAGAGLMGAGQKLAIAGTFGDNVLDLVDGLSSENGISQEEALDLFKETATELALLYSGAKINGVSANVQNVVLTKTQSKVLSELARLGTDASLSLLADLVITGEVNLSGEGISQILGIITGLAGARVNEYNDGVIKTASEMYSSGDISGACRYLDDNAVYSKTKSSLRNQWVDSEYQAAFKMAEDGLDYDAIMNYVNTRSDILSKQDIINIKENIGTRGAISALSDEFGIDFKSRFAGFDFSTAQGKAIASDIEMLYQAKTQGVDVNDLMVPSVKSAAEGINSAKIGDVFEVLGDDGLGQMFLKTADGMVEPLSISKEAYCRLFPAIDRYSCGQQASGDCYLVSSLNILMAKPEGRETILKCFSEDADGNITVKSPTSDTEILIKPGQTINDLGIETNKAVTASLGMQLAEYLYKASLVDSLTGKVSEILNEHNENILDVYRRSDDLQAKGINSIEEYTDYLTKTREDIISTIKVETGVEMDTMQMRQLVDYMQIAEGIYVRDGVLTEKGLEAYGRIFNTQDVDVIQKTCNKIFSQIDSETAYAMQENYFAQLTQKNLITQMQISPEEMGGSGGHSHDVFSFFSVDKEAHYEFVNDSKTLKAIIANPELQNNYMLTAGTLPVSSASTLMPELVAGHAYGVEFATSSTGEVVIKVTNPWALANSYNKSITLTLDEFVANFSGLYVAEIKK